MEQAKSTNKSKSQAPRRDDDYILVLFKDIVRAGSASKGADLQG